jgi:D-aminoacyl-tRNA deacylase
MNEKFEKSNVRSLKSLIVCSVTDPAGTNIRERLIESQPFIESADTYDASPVYELKPDIKLVTSRKGVVYVDDLDDYFDAERSVFISRHYAESGIPSLTAHFTGNFGNADFGGEVGEIARYSPALLKTYMRRLNLMRSEISESYNITLEATHHGPTSLRSTVLFVELGSSENQWRDVSAAEKVASALISTLRSEEKFSKCAICVGGTHYSEKFNAFLFGSEYAIGPIIPKYALEFFSPDLLRQIINKSDQAITAALVDRKGLGKFKGDILKILDETKLEIIYA